MRFQYLGSSSISKLRFLQKCFLWRWSPFKWILNETFSIRLDRPPPNTIKDVLFLWKWSPCLVEISVSWIMIQFVYASCRLIKIKVMVHLCVISVLMQLRGNYVGYVRNEQQGTWYAALWHFHLLYNSNWFQ